MGFDATNELGGTETLRKWRSDLVEFTKEENSWQAQWNRTVRDHVLRDCNFKDD